MPQACIMESYMRRIAIFLLALSVAGTVLSQQPVDSSHASSGATAFSNGPNLPVAKLGSDDLIGVSVYDSPELTRTVRVDAEGFIRLPMVKQRIRASGLLPVELESAIATALVNEQVMVSPIVTVSVVEYHSRPITVAGAVKSPTTFQASDNVTLLDAISRAGGLTSSAGAEILVSRPAPDGGESSVALVQRVSVHSLLDVADPASNFNLRGGESIRVPEAGQIFVVGNVKRPGAFPITNGSESSVLKALSLSGGLDSFASHVAYIYRNDAASGQKNEIPVNLKNILARKSPDVPLLANDMMYVPNESGLRASAKALEIVAGIGIGVASLVIFATH
jgi:polysaccharide export outer membrane protein